MHIIPKSMPVLYRAVIPENPDQWWTNSMLMEYAKQHTSMQ